MERIEQDGQVIEVPTLVTARGPAAVREWLAADASERSTLRATWEAAEAARLAAIQERCRQNPALDPIGLRVTVPPSEG